MDLSDLEKRIINDLRAIDDAVFTNRVANFVSSALHLSDNDTADQKNAEGEVIDICERLKTPSPKPE